MTPEKSVTSSNAAPGVLQTLQSRHSVPALQLSEPGPSDAQINDALDTAVCAPDHGALRPWRFVLIRGTMREQLSQLFARRMLERDPGTPPAKVEKARRQPLTAPLVIAVGARILSGHKIPENEQLLSSGAAVMNLLNAFHAQGYGAIWLTGGNAYDRQVADALGFAAEERCLGFVYVGSIGLQSPQGSRPGRVARAAVTREWGG